MEAVKAVFRVYCKTKPDMDGKSFSKCIKDNKLLGKKLTATDSDLIFAKIKTKSERRITFEQFIAGLEEVASRKGVDSASVFEAIAGSGGPVLKGTKTANVALHDDKSNYTGVHGKGGPSTVDKDKDGLSGLLDRSDADARGRKVGSGEKEPADKKSSKASAKIKSVAAPAEDLMDVFENFTKGAGDMAGNQFAKFAKDCKLLSKGLTSTDVDLVFAKVKTTRKITPAQFAAALEIMAEKRGQSNDELVNMVLSAGGPKFTGTKTDQVKLHDDKTTYTGVHIAGGPSTIDAGSKGLGALLDRSEADARGVKK